MLVHHHCLYGVDPVIPIMTGQIISKMLLSTILVPPLIYLFVALGRSSTAESPSHDQ